MTKTREFDGMTVNDDGSCQVISGDLQITFDAANCPMPWHVAVRRFDGSFLPVIVNKSTRFSITDRDGRIFYPRVTEPPSLFFPGKRCGHCAFQQGGFFSEDGSFQNLCPVVTEAGHPLTTGETSAEIDLNSLLEPGRHHLGIYATHLGEPFYSFFTATLSNGTGESYDIVFRNDLENDRAFLHFDVIIPEGLEQIC